MNMVMVPVSNLVFKNITKRQNNIWYKIEIKTQRIGYFIKHWTWRNPTMFVERTNWKLYEPVVLVTELIPPTDFDVFTRLEKQDDNIITMNQIHTMIAANNQHIHNGSVIWSRDSVEFVISITLSEINASWGEKVQWKKPDKNHKII